MKNNLIVLVLTLILLGGAGFYYQKDIVPQPDEIKRLNLEIEDKNKQLLAAQILAEKRGQYGAMFRVGPVNTADMVSLFQVIKARSIHVKSHGVLPWCGIFEAGLTMNRSIHCHCPA